MNITSLHAEAVRMIGDIAMMAVIVEVSMGELGASQGILRFTDQQSGYHVDLELREEVPAASLGKRVAPVYITVAENPSHPDEYPVESHHDTDKLGAFKAVFAAILEVRMNLSSLHHSFNSLGQEYAA